MQDKKSSMVNVGEFQMSSRGLLVLRLLRLLRLFLGPKRLPVKNLRVRSLFLLEDLRDLANEFCALKACWEKNIAGLLHFSMLHLKDCVLIFRFEGKAVRVL